MHKLWTVARRDFLTHLRKPTFLLTTLGVPLAVAFFLFISNSNRQNGSISSLDGVANAAQAQGIKPFGYSDSSGTIRALPAGFPPNLVRAFADPASGRAAVADGSIASLYVIPPDYRSTGTLIQYSTGVDAANGVSSLQLMHLLLRTNLLPTADAALALRLDEPMQVQTIATAAPAPGMADAQTGLLLATGFATVLTFAIFMSSGLLLQGLLEEKENRTLEVTLTSIAPQPFLLGKILGLGLLGLVQVAAWLLLARGGMGLGASSLGALGQINLPAGVWVLALAYFLLGYLFYAAVMAGIGAVSPSMRESSQYSVVVSLFAGLPLFVLSALAGDPSGGLAVGLSLFPPTAAVTMPIRLAVSNVPGWQVALSLALLALAIGGVIWLAARLFRTTTLLRGSRLAPREILRALAA